MTMIAVLEKETKSTLPTKAAGSVLQVFVEDASKPKLFVADSMPGSEVSFGSSSSELQVYFPSGSPLVGVTNPFKVNQGPPISVKLQEKALGTYPFEIVTDQGSWSLRIVVAQDGVLPKVGFQVVDDELAVTQATLQQPLSEPIQYELVNTLDRPTLVIVTENGKTSEITLPAHGTESLTAQPQAFGKSVDLEVRGTEIEQTGGTIYADILVEPPP